jgi:hypothetical protein
MSSIDCSKSSYFAIKACSDSAARARNIVRSFALQPVIAVGFRLAAAIAVICLAAPSFAQTPLTDHEKPDIDLYALMPGNCKTLKVAGHNFACKVVAFFHSERGRASFTVALDDLADESHVVSFSGEYGQRSQEDLYVLAVDRMELNSKDRPKVDGLPVPAVEKSNGVCQQVGNFAGRQVSSVTCSATDRSGQHYELAFESDGAPITLRRVRPSPPTIRMDHYQ